MQTSTTISASYGGVTKSTTFTVMPAAVAPKLAQRYGGVTKTVTLIVLNR